MGACDSTELLEHLLTGIEVGRFYPHIFFGENTLLDFLEREKKVAIVSVKPEIVLKSQRIKDKLKEMDEVEIFMTHWKLEGYVYKEGNDNLEKFKRDVVNNYRGSKCKLYICKFIFP